MLRGAPGPEGHGLDTGTPTWVGQHQTECHLGCLETTVSQVDQVGLIWPQVASLYSSGGRDPTAVPECQILYWVPGEGTWTPVQNHDPEPTNEGLASSLVLPEEEATPFTKSKKAVKVEAVLEEVESVTAG